MWLLRKAKVKAHTRRTSGGAVVQVREHQDKRATRVLMETKRDAAKASAEVVSLTHDQATTLLGRITSAADAFHEIIEDKTVDAEMLEILGDIAKKLGEERTKLKARGAIS